MTRCEEVQTTVLGGLPVIVRYHLAPAEPDIGVAGGIEVDDFLTIRRKPAPWVWARLGEKGLDDLYGRLETMCALGYIGDERE